MILKVSRGVTGADLAESLGKKPRAQWNRHIAHAGRPRTRTEAQLKAQRRAVQQRRRGTR